MFTEQTCQDAERPFYGTGDKSDWVLPPNDEDDEDY